MFFFKVDDKTARAIIESQIQHNHQLEDQVKQLKDQVQQLKDQVQQSKEQQKAMLDEKIKIQQEFYELRER